MDAASEVAMSNDPKNRPQNSRRDFLRGAVGAAALAETVLAQRPSPNGLPTRRLGRTNEQVSILGIGGGHIGRVAIEDQAAAVRLVHAAIDNGVTFMDNAWAYQDGAAEQALGEALQGGKRQKVFLMTKCTGRDTKFARQCLEDSLRRLKTDHLDLWQFHEVNYDNDPDWIFQKGGLEVALQAKKEGKVRHIGFTGHKDPIIHRKMLNMGDVWETSQMPINVMDYYYRSFQHEIVPLCLSRDVGVIGMKSLGGGAPLGKIVQDTNLTAEECVRFALSQPVSVLVRGWMKVEQIEADARIARDFKPLSFDEQRLILTKAKDEAGDGRHEQFKTTQRFENPIYRKMHGVLLEGS
jgi:predicted aldo/keto reductase-like oxidoreductase